MKSRKLKTLISTTLVAVSIAGITPAFSVENDFRLRAHQLNADETSEADIEAEIKFGKTIAARILGQYPIYKDQNLIRYVNLVGRTLALNSSRSDLQFYFTILDTDFINAYSAPGGYVFITRGAIAAMRNEAELAAVLAHEIAHISEKHIVKEFKIKGTDSSAAASLSQIMGSASSTAKVAFSQAVDNAVNKLFNDGFKHEDELEADRVALLLMASSGYDPMSLRRYLERIKQQAAKAPKKDKKHKATHPPTSERIAALDKIAQQEGLTKLRLPVGTARFAKYALNK